MWKQRLVRVLGGLGNKFATDELAYLSLTSKTEHAVRDRLAFALHQDFAPRGFKIAREWRNRFDLAVLRSDASPCCLVELKAVLAFDVINKTRTQLLPALLEDDRKKLKAYRAEVTANPPECFQLLLLARALQPPTSDQDKYIKYGRRIRQDPSPSDGAVISRVNELCERGIQGNWSGGNAYGIEVNMHFWLFSRNGN